MVKDIEVRASIELVAMKLFEFYTRYTYPKEPITDWMQLPVDTREHYRTMAVMLLTDEGKY